MPSCVVDGKLISLYEQIKFAANQLHTVLLQPEYPETLVHVEVVAPFQHVGAFPPVQSCPALHIVTVSGILAPPSSPALRFVQVLPLISTFKGPEFTHWPSTYVYPVEQPSDLHKPLFSQSSHAGTQEHFSEPAFDFAPSAQFVHVEAPEDEY